MPFTKRNVYIPGQNVANMAVNVDDNRLGVDKTEISVDFTTSPATVTIKLGSIIEINGNSYSLTGSDLTFQMANATDNYITITDNPSLAYSSAATKGTFSAIKQGYYQAGNLIRSLNWCIDQTNEIFFRETVHPFDKDFRYYFEARFTSDKLLTNNAGAWSDVTGFTDALVNVGGHFNITTGVFTAPETGLYMFDFSTKHTTSGNRLQLVFLTSRSSLVVDGYNFGVAGVNGNLYDATLSGPCFLLAGETLKIQYSCTADQTLNASTFSGLTQYPTFKGYILR